MTSNELEQLGMEVLKAHKIMEDLEKQFDEIEKKYNDSVEMYNKLYGKYQIHDYHNKVSDALDKLTSAYGSFKRSILNVKPAEILSIEQLQQDLLPNIKQEFVALASKIDEYKNLFLLTKNSEVQDDTIISDGIVN